MAQHNSRAYTTRRPPQQARRAARKRHQDARATARRRRLAQAESNRQSLLRLCSWLLPDDAIFAHVKLHGNTKWLPRCLAWLALCWAIVDAQHLTDAFDQAVGVCSCLLPCPLT